MDIFRRKKFDEAMFAKNRTLAIRVGQYQSSDIKEASFDYGYIKGDTYKPGGTCAGSAKIVFTSIITTFNKLDKVYPEIGLLVDGTYEWVKMGEYFINDIEIDRNRNTTKLDLMDGMFKLNREHVTDLTYPAEIRHVIKEICLKTGITLANEYMDITSMNYRIESIPKEKKMTFRDVLSLATQMLGMSCFFNREGKLEIKELTDSGITITADSYFMHGLTKSEIEYQIAGITCKKDKETLTVGLRTGRSLEIENVLMYQSALDNLYHSIKDIRYYPYSLNYQGHLLLDVGQWVTIKTNTGETFKSPVLSQSFTFKGGLHGRISADSKAGNDAQYSYAGTITKKIEQFNEIEAQIQSQLEEADKGFDQKVEKIKNDFSDQVELAKAKAEEVKRELSDTIDQRFSSFDNGPLQEIKRKAIEALQNAGASTLLAQEAKRIGLDSVAKLEEFKKQATSAQTALSGDLDTLKRTVASEVNQASEYRRTTTEALSRMTGQMDGFATKSEVAQGIDGLTQTFAKMKVGGRNLLRGSKGPFLPDRKPANFDNNILYVGNTSIYMEQGQEYTISAKTDGNFTAHHDGNKESDNVVLWIMDKDIRNYQIVSDLKTGTTGTKIIWNKPTGIYHLRVNTYHKEATKSVWDVKIEKGNIATDWSPAIEDVESQITEARTEFKQTADGLSTKMAAVETYVGQDNQRQESLRRYTREESARQATAVRELVARDYVGKATHQEDVRGLEHKFETITNPQNGLIATQIANYKQSVDGRFADITSLIAGKANQTDFQRVKETSQLYERILGNTDNGIANNVARMALTSQLFQVEVSKALKGGRNYIRNGQFKNGSKNWIEYQSVNFGLYFNYQHSKDPNNRNRPGAHFFHDSQNVANFFGLQQAFAFEGIRGEKVSVSLLVSKDGGDSYSGLRVALHYIKNKNIIGQEWQGIPSEQITSKYKRFTFTFTLSDDVDQMNLMLFGEKGKTINLYVTDIQLERGSVATDYKEASEDTDEASRKVQSQLAGAWGVHNKNSVNEIIAGFNLAGRNAGIKAETIRLEGNTLADKLTAIDGYFKRLFVGEGTFATLNTDILRANSITADKMVMDMAFFNKFVSNEAYLSQLFAKQAFINRVQSITLDASQIKTGVLTGGRIHGSSITGSSIAGGTITGGTITGGTITGSSISGATLTGHTKIQLGTYGSFDTVNGGLQINVPRVPGSKDGLGVQFIGSYGRGENVPYGLYIYKDPDFTTGNPPRSDDNFLLTVEGYIQAKGIGWLRTGTGSVGDRLTATIGLWNSSNVYLSFGGSANDIFYTYNNKAYSIWEVIKAHFSDRRLKENIVDCEHKALDYIHQFQFKEYDWKKQEDRPQQAHTKIGLIAQEVQKVDPTLVYENGDTLNLDNLRLTNIALKAIQELALENQKLTHRLENLENERRTA